MNTLHGNLFNFFATAISYLLKPWIRAIIVHTTWQLYFLDDGNLNMQFAMALFWQKGDHGELSVRIMANIVYGA